MMAETNASESVKVSEKSQEDSSQNALRSLVEENKWLIRESDLYYDEYKECTSFRGRFQQYFVFGETLDCNQWKKDYDNSCKWESKQDLKAAEAVINSERNRRLERLRAHYRNNIWEKRESPPEDWAKPLPDWLTKRNENTYLAEKAKELREGKTEEAKSSCTIM